MCSKNSMDIIYQKYLDSVVIKAAWTLFAESYCHRWENATVFYYIHTTFLISTCHNCVCIIALKLNSSHNVTMQRHRKLFHSGHAIPKNKSMNLVESHSFYKDFPYK